MLNIIYFSFLNYYGQNCPSNTFQRKCTRVVTDLEVNYFLESTSEINIILKIGAPLDQIRPLENFWKFEKRQFFIHFQTCVSHLLYNLELPFKRYSSL